MIKINSLSDLSSWPDLQRILKKYLEELWDEPIPDEKDLSEVGGCSYSIFTEAEDLKVFHVGNLGDPVVKTLYDRPDAFDTCEWISENWFTIFSGIGNDGGPVMYIHRSVLEQEGLVRNRVLESERLTQLFWNRKKPS